MSPEQGTRELDVTIITGLSGAGRSEAAHALEDLGWFVIDNLPPALIEKMTSLALTSSEIRRIALVIDPRGGEFFEEAADALDELRSEVGKFRLIFLEASDDALVRRFEANRRRHPMAVDDRVIVGIQRERELMRRLRDGADLTLDTSNFSVRDLRKRIGAFFEGGTLEEGMTTTVISFGYKYGLPLDADIVFDCRFLANPYWVEGLRHLTGLDEDVRTYVLDQKPAVEFVERVDALFDTLLPGFREEGRHYLTVAVGCTGGRHRSVVLADVIASTINKKGFRAKVVYRDVERPPVAP